MKQKGQGCIMTSSPQRRFGQSNRSKCALITDLRIVRQCVNHHCRQLRSFNIFKSFVYAGYDGKNPNPTVYVIFAEGKHEEMTVRRTVG